MLRRFLLLSVCLVPAAAWADADLPGAAEFVRRAGVELGATVGGAASPADKQERLGQFLSRVVDQDGLARFCLGRFWAVATPAQQAEYLRLFRLVLLRGLVSRLGDYQAVSVKVTTNTPSARADGVYVPTVVERDGNKPVSIAWLVTGQGPDMRIADVVAEGMSLRITQRSDYTTFLSRNDGQVDKLLAAMRARASAPAGE